MHWLKHLLKKNKREIVFQRYFLGCNDLKADFKEWMCWQCLECGKIKKIKEVK